MISLFHKHMVQGFSRFSGFFENRQGNCSKGNSCINIKRNHKSSDRLLHCDDHSCYLTPFFVFGLLTV